MLYNKTLYFVTKVGKVERLSTYALYEIDTSTAWTV